MPRYVTATRGRIRRGLGTRCAGGGATWCLPVTVWLAADATGAGPVGLTVSSLVVGQGEPTDARRADIAKY